MLLGRFKFRGAEWTVRYVKRFPPGSGKVFGQCVWKRDSASPHHGGVIRIHAGLTGQTRLDTELHEALHACLPDIDEEVVQRTATELSTFLWKAGYRNSAEGEV